jgi:hypothetical protein
MSVVNGKLGKVSRSTSAQSLLLVCLLVLAGVPAHASGEAAEPSLLQKLHEKKILTDEEYEQLQKRDSKIDKLVAALGGLSIGTLSYVDFSGGESGGDSYNKFKVTRGYINIKRDVTPWLRFRVTPDAHQEEPEADDDPNKADFEFRLKYLYAEFRPPDAGIFTNMGAEVGIGHMPWLDFEEHVNPYRAQGTMFIERAGIFNSADIGVSMQGYLGDPLDADYQKGVSKYYAGRWGSWHVGVYNGGGYAAAEDNENKVPEVRLSLRPLPDNVPGLQFSYFGLWGEGNKTNLDRHPDYWVNLGMVSYQDEWIILTAQYATARGNNKGSLAVPETDRALREAGYSFFFNTKLPVCDRKLNFLARYDHFDPDTENWVTSGSDHYDLMNGGFAWEFYPHWLAMLVYEHTMYQDNNGGLGKVPSAGKNRDDDWRVQTVLQIEI